MKISLRKSGDTTIIDMNGYLDLCSADSLKSRLKAYLDQSSKKNKIVFNLNGLNFIGSSGIRDFVKMLEEFYDGDKALVTCSGVNDEFRKIFKYSLENKDILEELFETDDSAANKMDI